MPAIVVAHMARQLAIADVGCLPRYLDREPTRHEHRAEIRVVYGYQDFGPPWSFRLTRWLYLRAWLGNERPSLLFDQATAWLIERKALLPGVTTLSRLVASVRERTATRLWRRLAALPSAEQQAQLDALLEIPQGTRYSRLISIQVLQEMYVNVTRKIRQPLSLAAGRGLVNLYRVWQVEVPSVETLLHASEIQDRNQLAFWDAMIVATAVQGGAEVLLSKDLNHGQVIEGVQITNPFAH